MTSSTFDKRALRGLPLAFAAAAVSFGAGPAFAQEGEVLIEVGNCMEIESPAERLACFESRVEDAQAEEERAARRDDRDVGRSGRDSRRAEPAAEQGRRAEAGESNSAAEPAGQSGASAARRSRRASGASAADDFGLREEEQAEREQREELVATIAELRERLPGRYVVTLDNGQVWQQTHAQRYRLREGQRVRIYSSGWGGSYRLSAEDLNGFVRVERVR